jgi:hypothetical protein
MYRRGGGLVAHIRHQLNFDAAILRTPGGGRIARDL